MGPEWGMSWGWGAGMMLAMAIFWIAVIVAAVWIVTLITRPRSSGRERTSLGLLEDRLARGEIDVDDFRARRTVIEERAI